jgi:hypothetical protein
VFALVHESSPATSVRFGRSTRSRPDQLTTFVGRADELRALRTALGETRLLTRTGAGGAGKTRLALQLAADCLALAQAPAGGWREAHITTASGVGRPSRWAVLGSAQRLPLLPVGG